MRLALVVGSTVALMSLVGCGDDKDDDESKTSGRKVVIDDFDVPSWASECFPGRFPKDEPSPSRPMTSFTTLNWHGSAVEQTTCSQTSSLVVQETKRATGTNGILGSLETDEYAEIVIAADGTLASATSWQDSSKSIQRETFTVTRDASGRVTSSREESDLSYSDDTQVDVRTFDANLKLTQTVRTTSNADGVVTDEVIRTYTPSTLSVAALFGGVYEEKRNGVLSAKRVVEADGSYVSSELIANEWRETSRSTPVEGWTATTTTSTGYDDDTGAVTRSSSETTQVEGDELVTISKDKDDEGREYATETTRMRRGPTITVVYGGAPIDFESIQTIKSERVQVDSAGTRKQSMVPTYDDGDRTVSETMTISFDPVATGPSTHTSTVSTCLDTLLCGHPLKDNDVVHDVTIKADYTYEGDELTNAKVVEVLGVEKSAFGITEEFSSTKVFE